jgi:hypothetical protein
MITCYHIFFLKTSHTAISHTFFLRMSLKGTVARDFRPLVFFIISTPPRALVHGLKPFCIWPNIWRKKSTIFEFWRDHWPRWNGFSGIIDPNKTISPVSLTTLKQQDFSYEISYEITKLCNNSKISCEISAGSLTYGFVFAEGLFDEKTEGRKSRDMVSFKWNIPQNYFKRKSPKKVGEL